MFIYISKETISSAIVGSFFITKESIEIRWRIINFTNSVTTQNLPQEAKTMSDNIIQLNENLIKSDLHSIVRSSAEENLNALDDHEAEELVNAEKYMRSGECKGYRSGHYSRNFQTTVKDATLKIR